MDSISGTTDGAPRPLLIATAEPGRLSLQPIINLLSADEKKTFAAALGTSRVTLDKWLAKGVDAFTADRIAITVADEHPILVWGDAWFALVEEDDEDDADF